MRTNEQPLTVTQDEANDGITIEGIRYARGLFRDLAFLPEGRWTQLVKRRDGVLTLRSVGDDVSAAFDRQLADE